MKRFDTDIGALDTALQQAPEVLQSVSVDVPACVGFSVVNHVVDVLGIQSSIGSPRIGEHLRTGFDIRLNPTMQGFALNVRNNRSADLAVALQQSHDCDFARAASTGDFLAPFVLVHVTCKSA